LVENLQGAGRQGLVVGDVMGCDPIIFDDEISTGGTPAATANTLADAGVRKMIMGAKHPVLCGDAVNNIADFLYATGYQSFFNYGQPAVKLVFCDISSTFEGPLAASGLKPNFAYQMKLVGKPTKVYGAGGDDRANEQIGYAGRWWRSQPDPGNADDVDYEAHKDDPNYIYEGYLLAFEICKTRDYICQAENIIGLEKL